LILSYLLKGRNKEIQRNAELSGRLIKPLLSAMPFKNQSKASDPVVSANFFLNKSQKGLRQRAWMDRDWLKNHGHFNGDL
jgi:hypothetical protein